METSENPSRRSFFKSTAALASLFMGPALWATGRDSSRGQQQQIFKFSADGQTENKVSGLLYSQVGYNLADTPRVVIRIPEKNALPR